MANCDTCSYSGCKYSKKLVEALIREVGVKNFIETGTYKGNTTRDVATEFPDVNIQTVELSAQYHQSVKPTLESFKNVKSLSILFPCQILMHPDMKQPIAHYS